MNKEQQPIADSQAGIEAIPMLAEGFTRYVSLSNSHILLYGKDKAVCGYHSINGVVMEHINWDEYKCDGINNTIGCIKCKRWVEKTFR